MVVARRFHVSHSWSLRPPLTRVPLPPPHLVPPLPPRPPDSQPAPAPPLHPAAAGPAAAAGARAPDTASFLKPQHIVANARVGAAVMGKYAKEGYSFVARVKLSPGKVQTPTVAAGSPAVAAAAAR